jgi:hypothetical protein
MLLTLLAISSYFLTGLILGYIITRLFVALVLRRHPRAFGPTVAEQCETLWRLERGPYRCGPSSN